MSFSSFLESSSDPLEGKNIGEPGPLLSGLVGREESNAVSLNTRSKIDDARCELEYGEPGAEEAAMEVSVWFDWFNHWWEDWGIVTNVCDSIAAEAELLAAALGDGVIAPIFDTDERGVWILAGGVKWPVVTTLRFFRTRRLAWVLALVKSSLGLGGAW
jgi:hypothetical protein